ncbi:MAG: hypothetical protein L6Q29_00850 [Candidatus Pacebacteria bacterium]|nr:hypothetical protein [Candidatus Paceibacterota bacterium]
MEQFLNLFLIVLGVGGFALAFYIHKSKKKAKPMVCPLDGHCDEVVHSEYSEFFGISLEKFGMAYYAAVALAYGAYSYFSSLPPYASFVLFFLTAGAFLFSLYLTFIQAFNLRKWCTWCLISAGICSFIFVASLFAVKSGFTTLPLEIFAAVGRVFEAINLLAAAMAVGSSAVSLVILIKFAGDMDISAAEAETIHLLSQVFWFSMASVVLSGFGLFLSDGGIPTYPAIFWLKFLLALFLIGLAAAFNLVALPKAIKETAIIGGQGKGNLSKEEALGLLAMSMTTIAASFAFFILSAFPGFFVFLGFANLSIILIVVLAVFASAGRRLGETISLGV